MWNWVSAHLGMEHELLTGSLPWDEEDEIGEKIVRKVATCAEELAEECPRLGSFWDHCRGLGPEELADYGLLRSPDLLRTCAQESNRFRETTLRAMCELVQNMHKKYHDWTACEEDFLSKYGAAKIHHIHLKGVLHPDIGPEKFPPKGKIACEEWNPYKVNAHLGVEQSFRDDAESLCYAPWQGWLRFLELGLGFVRSWHKGSSLPPDGLPSGAGTQLFFRRLKRSRDWPKDHEEFITAMCLLSTPAGRSSLKNARGWGPSGTTAVG
ncbi:unnamed protein product [Cladocopium goreaui]|uniref:Uncharacterized protein n=1 Tax=Cladocopium goreaui TaxID=2562237 RepID=A0A9P1BW72_9DINO|nr:unnamed protein product [Cladocopium goreaui]